MSVQPAGPPERQGLYDPRNEHDACGVGFIADVKGRKSNDIIAQGLQILVNLDHRGAVGADPLVGDGAGCLIQIPIACSAPGRKGPASSCPSPATMALPCASSRRRRMRARPRPSSSSASSPPKASNC